MTATDRPTAPRPPRRVVALPGRWAAGLVIISGLAGVAAFPRLGWWPLAMLSVGGFCGAVHGQSARRGAWLGYLYGWAFFGPLLVWTGTFVGPVWLLLPFAEAGFFAVLGAALPTLQRSRFAPVLIALAWVAEEAGRDRFPFGGFPWGRWAFSQSQSPLRWFAAVGGAPLVTAMVALIGAGLWVAGEGLRAGAWRPATFGAGLAVGGVLLASVVWIPVHPRGAASHEVIAVIQGDVPDRGLEFNERRRQVLDNHVKETLGLAADIAAGRVARPSLVLWPENASDIDPFTNADARAQIERSVQAVGVPILVGAVLDGAKENQIINAGILWSPTTGPGARYVKRHPVPFGEYMPFRSIAEAITPKAKLVRDMVAGSGNGLVRGGPVLIGDVICFEVAYDSLVRSSVRAGAQLLVVQTNNATFGHSAETYQQLAMTRLRAVEFGRSIVQVATSGKSAVIGPDGHTLAESGALFTAASLVTSVPISSSTTLATRLGEWPEWIMTGGAIVALVGLGLRRRRPSRPGPGQPSTAQEAVLT